MDLRVYYRKVREAEATLVEQYPLMVSQETSDGGRPGVVMEVARGIAAKLMVEGKATLANEEQRAAYLAQQEAQKIAAEKAEFARRVQVAIIAESDLHGSKKK